MLIALAAAGVLAAVVGSASASRLAVSNQLLRWTWASMTFRLVGNNVSITCPVTLEGSFHSRTISKVTEALIGYITRAIIAEAACTRTNVTSVSFLPERLPWHIRYSSFTGMLPTILTVAVRVKDAGIRLATTGFGNCLYLSVSGEPLIGSFERNTENEVVTGFTWSTTATIPRIEGLCPIEAKLRVEGAGSVMLLATTTVITIRLVA